MDSVGMSQVKFLASSVYVKLKGREVTITNDIKYEEVLKDGSKVSWVLTKGTLVPLKFFIIGLMLSQVNAWLFKSFMEEHYSGYLTRQRRRSIYTRISDRVGMKGLLKLIFIYL